MGDDQEAPGREGAVFVTKLKLSGKKRKKKQQLRAELGGSQSLVWYQG